MIWSVFAKLCFAFAVFTGGPSYACSLANKPIFWRDRPIEVKPDGSFDEAGESFHSSISGKAPVDIGAGKIGQRITHTGGCSFVDYLLVVDCVSLEMIVIEGLPDPEAIGYSYYEIFRLYPPDGKIRLTKSVTVAELAAISAAEGYEYETDPQKAFAVKNKKNTYNPFTGCKVLYPESPGATQ